MTAVAILIVLGSALGWTLFNSAGVVPESFKYAGLAIAATGGVAVCCSKAPGLPRRLLWPLLLIPMWIALQMIPLPQSALAILSPASGKQVAVAAAVLDGVAGGTLSLVPARSMHMFVVAAACTLLFLAVREASWRLATRPWAVTLPLVLLASAEALLALLQVTSGGPGAIGRGTYVNRNHLAGLLELVLPFPVMYAAAVLRRNSCRWSSPLRPAVAACVSLSFAALILFGSVYSLSRMGFTAAMLAVFVCAIGYVLVLSPVAGRRSAYYTRIGLMLALSGVIVLFLFVPPDELIIRFGQMEFADGLTRQDRLQLWRESLPLLAAYPVFGCGAGAYEAAYTPFKVGHAAYRDDYAHNDYLQSLIELGGIGFVMLAVLFLGLLFETAQATSRHSDTDGRAIAVACLASFCAIMLHSTADFNLYIPANALTLAWISAIGASVMFSSRPGPAPAVIEVAGWRSSRFALSKLGLTRGIHNVT